MKFRLATGFSRTVLFLTGIALLQVSASRAGAQQAAPAGQQPARVYAAAAGLFTTQPGTSLDTSGATPLEGSGPTFTGIFGAGGRVGVEAEFSRGPQLNGLLDFHVSGGTATYTSTFRDTLVSAFVRYRGSPSARVLVEPVGGVTLAFGQGTLDYGFVSDGSTQPDYPWQSDVSRRSLGLGGGADVMVRVGPRAAVGGLFRLHRLLWNEEHGLDVPNLGLGRWIFQAGATVSVALTAPRLDAGSSARAAGRENGGPRGYAGGFGALFIQPVGEVDGHYLTEGVGGHGFGFGATAGAFISPKWSVAAEVAVGPELEAESSFAGRIRYDTRYRDTLISGLFRWHSAPSAGVHWEPVFGVTAAAAHVPRTETWVSWSGTPETVNDATIDRISFGVVGGADVVIGGRVAGVASVRVHVLDRRDSTDDQPPELGVGRFVYILGGGIRFTF